MVYGFNARLGETPSCRLCYSNRMFGPRRCGARLRDGRFCGEPPMSGNLRCRWHGARGGRPKGIPEHPHSRAARLEGRRRWVERMRGAKARGEIERFPNGARARDLPPLSKDRTIRRAQRLLEKAKVMADQEIATVPERPWSELTKAEKLGDVTNVALDIAREILALGVDPSDPKILQIVKDTALSVISNQIRVDTAVLAASVSSPAGLTEEQRRERARQAIREAFAERSQPCNSTLDGDAGS